MRYLWPRIFASSTNASTLSSVSVPHVRGGRAQPVLVEHGAHFRRRVVEVLQRHQHLDVGEADGGDVGERPVEVDLRGVAQRVELHADAIEPPSRLPACRAASRTRRRRGRAPRRRVCGRRCVSPCVDAPVKVWSRSYGPDRPRGRLRSLAAAGSISDLGRPDHTHRMTRMEPTSRRDFLRMTAIAAAGVPLARPLIPSIAHRATPTTSRQERKLGFALVGLGSLSTNQIAPALQKTKHCRLAGIVTGTPAKAEKWKAQYGIPDRSIYNYDTMAPDGRQSGHRRRLRRHAERASRARHDQGGDARGSTCSARSRWRCRPRSASR